LKAYHSIQAWFPFIFGCSKNWYIHCKTMFMCWVFLFCDGFTLGPMAHSTHIYLWRKVVCFVVMRSTELGCFRSCSWCLWKAFDKEGCMGLVTWCLDLWCKSSWILNDFSLEIKLNQSWNFQRNWNVPLVFLERSWWAGFNEIYLIRFGFRMWEVLIFKWFLLLKIQINSKKPRFGRKNQLRTW
jgi:hypothetical protein